MRCPNHDANCSSVSACPSPASVSRHVSQWYSAESISVPSMSHKTAAWDRLPSVCSPLTSLPRSGSHARRLQHSHTAVQKPGMPVPEVPPPVNTIAMPCSSAAATTSASRIEPPGCTTAVAPAAATASSPSRNGKNASEAATDPRSRSGVFCAAFITATFTASTRLICPAPMASVRSAPVKMTVFDFTCAHTRHAKRSACHSAADGLRLVGTVRPAVAGLPSRAAPRSPRPAPARARPRESTAARDPARRSPLEAGDDQAHVRLSSPGSAAHRRRRQARRRLR